MFMIELFLIFCTIEISIDKSIIRNANRNIKMKDLHGNYLDAIRDYANFYCVKQSYVKVILKSSNEFLRKKKYCIKCVAQQVPIRDQNCIDIKYMFLKQKHYLKMDFEAILSEEERERETEQCTNPSCVKNIKRFRFENQCVECKKMFENDDFMKNMINSVTSSEFPEELTFSYFVKNQQESLELNDAYNVSTKYFHVYEQFNIWCETDFMQTINEQSNQFLIKNEFNVNKNVFIKTLKIYDETERKNKIVQALQIFFLKLNK